MPLSREEYATLLQRRERNEIVFFYDPAQCRQFFASLNPAAFKAETGHSLRTQCNTIKIIMYAVEPLSLLVCIVASLLWLKWWGVLVGAGVLCLWMILGTMSSAGRQSLAKPIMVFAVGLVAAAWFHSQGVGFVVFMLSLSTMYLSMKMLYALPVLFFSLLTSQCYEFVNLVYEQYFDSFNRKIGCPIMWHVETVDGRIPGE